MKDEEDDNLAVVPSLASFKNRGHYPKVYKK